MDAAASERFRQAQMQRGALTALSPPPGTPSSTPKPRNGAAVPRGPGRPPDAARHRRALLPALAILLAAATVWLAAQTAVATGVHPVTGRRYAAVMSYEGAEWLDRAEREREEAPERALDALDLREGATVADVGAGSGYMTVRLARRVGPSGRVFATDLQPQMLAILRARLATEDIDNVTLVQGTVADPRLPRSALDLILMVDVYHELSEPQRMLRRLRDALKPDGRLVLLEYRKEDPSVPIRFGHKMSVAEARAELEAEGFRLLRVDGRLPRQHILIFGRQ